MFQGIKFAISLTKAYELDAKGKYNEALQLLDKYSNYVEEHCFSFPDYYIFKASIYYRLNMYKDAKVLLEKSLKILEKNEDYNESEKNYLKKYIYTLLYDISCNIKHTLLKSKYQKLMKIITYDEGEVKKTLKLNFPIA